VTTRRGRKHEGTIRERHKGLWEGRLDFGYVDGKHHRKSYYGKTAKEVQEKLLRARADAQNGITTKAKGATVGAFLEKWLVGLDLEPLTIRAYSFWTRRHIIPELGRIKLEKLTAQDVDSFLKSKLRDCSKPKHPHAGDCKPLSPQSVTHIRAVLRAALGQAEKFDLIPRNAAVKSDAPRVPKYEATFLSPTQAMTLLATAKGDRLEALYACALTLGLRIGEALGLQWQNIDLDKRQLRVCTSVKQIPGKGLVVAGTKRGKGRNVVIPESIVRQLRAHALRQQLEARIAGDLWVDSGLVFTTHQGRPLSPTNVERAMFKPLVRRAGLPDRLRFHDLRHSAATLMLAEGVPARVVMEVLGHSGIAITMNRYTHVVPQLMDDAAKAMDRLLGAS
jgi:integrase